MRKYYKERFLAHKRIARRLASSMEANEILEVLRDEARAEIPGSMEVCILLLDPDAPRYTRPLQCSLYDRPVNCLSCKRDRAAVQKALAREKAVVVSRTGAVHRRDGTVVETGPEGAVPVLVDDRILGVVSVVIRPGGRFTKRDLYFARDIGDMVANGLNHAKRHWLVTQEKLAISKRLSSISPFVPQTVRQMAERDPQALQLEKQKRDVTVLFLDLEDYTRLSARLPEGEVNDLVERTFSRFVDPIQRSHGEINETAGDGLMILFTDGDAQASAENAARAALEIQEQAAALNRALPEGLEPLHVNMGINSGSALVGMSRFRGALAERMTYTASGQVTNLAARLAGLAAGGEILIGEETRRRVQGMWPLKERGTHRLKGLDEAVHVYELLPGDPERNKGPESQVA